MYNINLKTILIYFSQRNKYSMSSLPKGFFEFAKLKNQTFVDSSSFRRKDAKIQKINDKNKGFL